MVSALRFTSSFRSFAFGLNSALASLCHGSSGYACGIPEDDKLLYSLTINQNFPAVINACAARDETWLNDELIALYIELHQMGHADSVECWQGTALVGGLYGVRVPDAPVFCGESMFSTARDASKLCLVRLVEHLRAEGFAWLDAQFQTPHLAQFNFKDMRRADYEKLLQRNIK
jgi:leucyl/phenylalanyl-tRNA--protein transferase